MTNPIQKQMQVKYNALGCMGSLCICCSQLHYRQTIGNCGAGGGGEIAQSLASLSIKQATRVCAQHDLLVIERWNPITVLSTRSHQCRKLVQKRSSMCHYICVIMHVKDTQLSVVTVGHCVPLAGFCLSLYDLHALNRDVSMIETNICHMMLLLCGKKVDNNMIVQTYLSRGAVCLNVEIVSTRWLLSGQADVLVPDVQT